MKLEYEWTWFLILMWFWIEEVLKLTNLSKWVEQPNSCMGDENSTKNWKKINLTSYEMILILDHEETSPVRFWDVFHEIRSNISFHNPWWKSWSHEVRWKKKLEVWWKNSFVFWNGVRSLSFLLWKVFTLHKLRWDENFWKLEQNPLNSKKTLINLSLLVFPLALQS